MRLPPLVKPSCCGLLALVAVVACGPSVSPTVSDVAEDPGTTSSEAMTSDDSGGGTTALPDPIPATSEDTADEPVSNFIDEPDWGGESYECDTWVQDCPAGQKCTFWANDGGGAWNATRCVEIAPDAAAPGEPCTVEGSGTTGIDTCELGSMCWDVDPETFEGTCIEFCTGSESNPFCTDPTMLCAGRGPYLCLPTCCPIEQDCPEGQGCYPVNDTFSCAPDASMDAGGYGDACEFINVCDPGMMCLGAESVPDCAGSAGCCTAYCEVGSMSCSLLHPDLECVAWFEEDHAPPGQELIGACVLPQ